MDRIHVYARLPKNLKHLKHRLKYFKIYGTYVESNTMCR